MMLYESFDSQREFQGDTFFREFSKTDHNIRRNLKEGLVLRPYQEEALGRFFYYMENFQKKKKPVHLLFNMATGSGKTNVMAGAIIYLYGQGYRNFIFFTRLDQIVAKTRINFLNSDSSKYSFSKKLVIDNREVLIKEVKTFDGANSEDINILFTTTAGLHNQLLVPRENGLSLDNISNHKIVLLADEAHNLSVETSKKLTGKEELEVESWEKSVLRVLRTNPNSENILLEFTATARLDSGSLEIIDKYRDKAIYKYSLKEFRSDGYSKEINTIQIDAPLMERVLASVVISQYRLKVAEKFGLSIKPVILFKANRVYSSKGEKSDWSGESIIFSNEFKQRFHEMISSLDSRAFKALEKINDNLLKRALKCFSDIDETYENLIVELKLDFAENKCLTVDTDRNAIEKQVLLNSLESPENLIRAIFATESLNEGWDVLNLYDIVRLYNTRDSSGNKAGGGTIKEAQLIGRGARYFPFALKEFSEKDKRKFDSDIGHELRIIEELNYHSRTNSKYIAELRQVLVRDGLIPETTTERIIKVKDSIKSKNIWITGVIFANEKQKNFADGILSLSDAKASFNENIEQNIFVLPTRIGIEESLLEQSKLLEHSLNLTTKTFRLSDFGKNVLRSALWATSLGNFNSLKRIFGRLDSLNEFIDGDEFLGSIKVKVRGSTAQLDNLTQNEKYEVAIFVISRVLEQASQSHHEFVGSRTFTPRKISSIFGKEKELRLPSDGTRKDPITTKYPHIDLNSASWFAQNEVWGTDQEESFVAFINDSIGDLNKKYEDVVLFRNEMHFPIFSFEDGEAFYPDFVLMLQERKNEIVKVFQVFVEPKGDHLFEQDSWKQDLLLRLNKEAIITFESEKYRLIGLPFFNKGDLDISLNEKFTDSFANLMTEK